MAVGIGRLKEYMMSRIDKEDLVEVEKVERYCSLVKLARELDKEIKKTDFLSTTINGSQEFEKASPLLSEFKSINSQINATGKTINFKKKPPQKPALINSETKKVSLI